MSWFDILGVYAIFSYILFMLTCAFLDASDYKAGDFKSLFSSQYGLYESAKDELNLFGIIILEALVTILTFGASAIMFVFGIVSCIFIQGWKLFYFIFKKR